MSDSSNPLKNMPERPEEREAVALPGPSLKYQGKAPEYSKGKPKKRSSRSKRKRFRRNAVIAVVSMVGIAMIASLLLAYMEHRKALGVVAANDEKSIEDRESNDSESGEAPEKGTVAAARSRSGNPMMVTNSSKMEAVGAKEAELQNRRRDRQKQETLSVSDEVLAKLNTQSEQILGAGDKASDSVAIPAGSLVADSELLGSSVSRSEAVELRDLTPEELDAAELAFEALLEVTEWKELLKLVRNPDEAEPKMAAYYGDPANKLKIVSDAPNLTAFHISVGGDEIIRCEVDGENFSRRVAFLMKEDGQYRLDWESFVHYLPLPWGAILEGRPPGITTVRVQVTRGDLYSPPFEDKSEFVCYKLNRIVEDGSLFGYVKRNSDQHKILEDAVTGSGGTASLVVGLQYPKDASSSRQVRIVRVISRYWLVR